MSKQFLWVTLTVLGGYAPVLAAPGGVDAEIERLASLLDWRVGATVADVGAGNGQMTKEIVRAVGPTGRVFASEIDAIKRGRLEALSNQTPGLVVIEGKPASANLPATCCDSAVMRRVYHHIADPAAFNASLRQSVPLGGRLAIIDFGPSKFLGLVAPVRSVPANRGRHGIAPDIVIRELTSAGFRLRERIDRWPGGGYCVVFENQKD